MHLPSASDFWCPWQPPSCRARAEAPGTGAYPGAPGSLVHASVGGVWLKDFVCPGPFFFFLSGDKQAGRDIFFPTCESLPLHGDRLAASISHQDRDQPMNRVSVSTASYPYASYAPTPAGQCVCLKSSRLLAHQQGPPTCVVGHIRLSQTAISPPLQPRDQAIDYCGPSAHAQHVKREERLLIN